MYCPPKNLGDTVQQHQNLQGALQKITTNLDFIVQEQIQNKLRRVQYYPQ